MPLSQAGMGFYAAVGEERCGALALRGQDHVIGTVFCHGRGHLYVGRCDQLTGSGLHYYKAIMTEWFTTNLEREREGGNGLLVQRYFLTSFACKASVKFSSKARVLLVWWLMFFGFTILILRLAIPLFHLLRDTAKHLSIEKKRERERGGGGLVLGVWDHKFIIDAGSGFFSSHFSRFSFWAYSIFLYLSWLDLDTVITHVFCFDNRKTTVLIFLN